MPEQVQRSISGEVTEANGAKYRRRESMRALRDGNPFVFEILMMPERFADDRRS